MGTERGLSDRLIQIITALVGLIQTIVIAWCWSISTDVKSNTQRITRIEGKVDNMAPSLEEVRLDVKKLLARR